MSEEKEITLSVNEQNWAIYHWCGIPYQEVKKIDDPEERKFLLGMAVYMKSEHEERQRLEQEKEQKMTSDLQEQLTRAWGEVPNPDETTS